MSAIVIEGNKLNPDIYLELFDFDATPIGGTISYYTNTPTGGGVNPITWKTNNYYPFPFELQGAEQKADSSALPRPTITVSSVNTVILAAIRTLGDLRGMQITRYRTFYKFTDNGNSPNSTMHFPIDEWTVIREPMITANAVQFELGYSLDRQGLKLPRKQILVDPTPRNPSGFPGVSRLRRR